MGPPARDHARVVDTCGNRLLQRLEGLPAGRALLRALRGAGEVALVGGAVRDLIRGEEPGDLDLVIDGELEPVLDRLQAPARRHERFGTATVIVDGHRYDLARARSERYPVPGALPQVTPASLESDLRRRDFTVNAMALRLGGSRRGELSTVPGSHEDLRSQILRVLRDVSFHEDPTRLLRLARYGARLGFTPEPHTRTLVAQALRDGVLQTVSADRIGTELALLAAEPDPAAAFDELQALGVADQVLPCGRRGDPAVLASTLALLGSDGDRVAATLAAVAFGAPGAAVAAWANRLGAPASRRDTILTATSRASAVAQALSHARSAAEIAGAVAGGPVELVALAGALGPAEAAVRWLTELRHVGLHISGSDLLEAGVAPGPAVGVGLRAALAATLDGRATGRSQQLAQALAAARAHPD